LIDPTSRYINALRGPILVTGASGFIGANLYKAIAAVRSDVFAIERHPGSWRLDAVRDDRVIALDLTDEAATQNLIETIAPQTVFNCVAYGAYSFEANSKRIYETNFLATTHLVQLLSQRSIAAFIHAGSSSEYGRNSAAPIETSLPEPNSDYAVSKVATAMFLQYMGVERGFPCLNLRLYSVYGPLEDTSRLIPNVVRRALAGEFPAFVDPSTSRDFVYVDDVCRAFILAAVKMNPDIYGSSINIGSGKKTTIRELAGVAKRTFDVAAEPKFGSMEGRAWDRSDWYADPALAVESIGWQATTELGAGLQLTASWISTLDRTEFEVQANKSVAILARSVSAIIACYKDRDAIPIMHERLTATFEKLGIDYEIIFVNDGSPDDSAEVIERLSVADPHVLGIRHSRNFGSQMAFRSGMEMSTKDGVVLLDGDLQDPPELIEPMYRKWNEGYDVIYGERVKRDMPPLWGLLYKAFYRVFAAFSYIVIPLDAGDFSLMDRRVVGWLLNCPERDLFVRGLRAYVGFKQTGVHYNRPERVFGKSTNSFFKNIAWAKTGIFSFSNTPLTMLTTSGIILLFLSIAVALVSIGLRIAMPSVVPPGITTVLVAVLFLGAFNVFAVGVIGEYIAKIMAEVKARPRLIRSAITRNGHTTELLPDGKSAKPR
jgi:polyisoprenyl-phosphate glycosyltransferase